MATVVRSSNDAQDPSAAQTKGAKALNPIDLAIPMFGYKSHVGIDRVHGRIRTRDASAANAPDSARLPELIGEQNTGSGIWADTAYRSERHEAFLEQGMFKSNIHQRRMPRRPLPEQIARANAKRSAVRSAVRALIKDRHGQPCLYSFSSRGEARPAPKNQGNRTV